MQHNGTTYHDETPADVASALEKARRNGQRVRIWYGNTETGEAWPDEFLVIGYIGRSTGLKKIPLMVHNRRSLGGPGLLDHCIVRIDTTSGQTLYRHPSFSTGFEGYTIRAINDPSEAITEQGLEFELLDALGAVHSRHRTREQAQRLVGFLRGDRYAK